MMINKEKIINISLGIIFVVVILFTLYSYFNNGIIYYLFKGDITALSTLISSSSGFAAMIFIFLVILESIIAPIPALILYVAGGIIFGPLVGGTYSLIGNILGAALAFQISRHWARDYFEKRISLKMKNQFDNFSLKHGPLAIFFLRLNPFTSSDLISYIAGLSKMKFWKFTLGTLVGLAPLVYLQTYLGSTLSSNPLFVNIFMVISALYVIGFTVIFIYLQINKNKKEKEK